MDYGFFFFLPPVLTIILAIVTKEILVSLFIGVYSEIMARDRKHIIVCIKNIDAEIEARMAQKADRRKSATYTQIAERLADHYDLIYYIDCGNEKYT